MKQRHSKATASSTRAGFGQASAFSTFASAPSSISYLAEQPDLTLLSEPNVAVHFKNISKRDATTKSKALDELTAFLVAENEQGRDLEEGFIDAWVRVFPRLSIDASRRVRQSTFTLQKSISKATGKRIARHMPVIAPPWLAGSHDSDRGVARAAHEGLQSLFSTPEKQLNLRKAYQINVLDFTSNIINNETHQSLSDPKNTSSEDAESVYNRVVSGSLHAATDMLSILPIEELQKQTDAYGELLASDKLLSLLSKGDAAVRRSVIQFIKACFTKLRALVNSNIDPIADAVLSKRTIRHQSGSSRDFSELLCLLTSGYPHIWERQKSLEVFNALARHGSQNGVAQFWLNLTQLILALPESVLPSKMNETKEVLESVHEGFTRKEEPRTNYTAAFRCYSHALERLSENLSPDDRFVLAESMGFSVIHQYLKPSQESFRWSLPDALAGSIVVEFVRTRLIQRVAEMRWDSLVHGLIEDLKTSLPAQSKDFETSQAMVESQAERLFSLQASLRGDDVSDDFAGRFLQAHTSVVQESIDLLKTRSGKPFGAAGCIIAALKNQNHDRRENALELEKGLDKFIESDLSQLLFTPSRDRLITILHLCSDSGAFNQARAKVLEAILHHSDQVERRDTLAQFLSFIDKYDDTSFITGNQALQKYLTEDIVSILKSGKNDDMVDRALKHSSQILSQTAIHDILSQLRQGFLEGVGSLASSLEGFKGIAKANANILRNNSSEEEGLALMQGLLKIQEQAEEEDALIATELLSIVDSSSTSRGAANSTEQVIKILEKSLYDASQDSLVVSTLVDLALRQHNSLNNQERLEKLLPDLDRWSMALEPYLTHGPPPSFAITDVLGGAVYLTTHPQTSVKGHAGPSTDSNGFSSLLRISLYTTKLLLRVKDANLRSFEPTTRQKLTTLLALTSQIANDKLSYDRANNLWVGSSGDEDALTFRTEAGQLIQQVMTPNATITSRGVSSAPPESTCDILFTQAHGFTPAALHHARIWASLKSEAIERLGWPAEQGRQVEEEFVRLRSHEDDYIRLVAYLRAFKTPLTNSPVLPKFLNGIISDLTGLDSAASAEVHPKLVLLSVALCDSPSFLDSVAKQRLVFFVKHIVPWLSKALPDGVKAEICKNLTHVLPYTADVYGDDWHRILSYLTEFWSSIADLDDVDAHSAKIALCHATLKLFATLKNLVDDEDTNDDLKESWREKLDELPQCLTNLLNKVSRFSDESNQPLRMTSENLARQIKSMPSQHIGDITALYALLDAQSREVQQTAFDILHRQIPKAQEEISVNIALDKSVARLPDELLSLLVQAPDVTVFDELEYERLMPIALSTYFSSWLLTFDHFRNASDKVKHDYIAHIKEYGVHTALLDLIFGALGHAQAKPVDASKFDPTFYSFGIEQSTKRDVQWLLIHLYYLCLSRLPSLAKSWWINCHSRKIRAQVEPWTEKNFSPLVIADALQNVAQWAQSQDESADDALVIKTNERTKEVTAAKEIDDQMLRIAVRFPANYPFGQVIVEGVNRVAVDDKKWKNWLLNTQGVITFSDNSIADGLIAFRKNLSGQLKGQSECAICYSMVSEDKQLPTKKCRTCKNFFHGICLFKWFKSSNSSTCPLCRTAFNYA